MAKFAGLNTQVLGISIDHVPCLRAWADSLGGINYPLLSDFWPHGNVAECYGVLRPTEGRSERAIFLIDKNGILRYIDVHDIDTQPDNEVLFAELRKIDPSAASNLPLEVPQDAPLPHGGIVMYCTPWCGDCRRARAWLDERGLAYTEVDISRNPKARAQVRAWADGHETTPTFDIDGTILVDFKPERLAQVLGV
jgi:glutaredoxin